MPHHVHKTLPSGFVWANNLQTAEYNETGGVRGAGKVVFVEGETPGTVNLAVRLQPPERWSFIVSEAARRQAGQTGFVVGNPDNREALAWYVREYNLGYRAAARASDSKVFEEGAGSIPWNEGYMDRAAGRAKWHLTYCTNHDNTKAGCGDA
jgi:hypothetical protein